MFRTRKDLLFAILIFLWMGCSNVVCVLLYGDTGGEYSNGIWAIIMLIFLKFRNKGKFGEWLNKELNQKTPQN